MRTAVGSDPSQRMRVLVCDDERHIVRLVQVNLERQGYRVNTALDGRAALEKMKADHPDLVVLDTDMPGMSGKEVWQAMQEDPDLAGIPVIMLGKKDDWTDGDGNGPTGVAMFLAKPFSPVQISEYLRAM